MIFYLDEEGGNLLFELTSRNMGERLCILFDGIAITAPTIAVAIGDTGVITGYFAIFEQTYILSLFNSGIVPAAISEKPDSIKMIKSR